MTICWSAMLLHYEPQTDKLAWNSQFQVSCILSKQISKIALGNIRDRQLWKSLTRDQFFNALR